jgi:hypothetical protein
MAKGRRGVEQDRGDTGEGLVVVCKGMIRKSYWAMARDRLGRERRLLSCTEFQSCVECSFDIDIMPFAVPFRMKSACMQPSASVPFPCKADANTYLFYTINKCVMNIEQWSISQCQPPW